MRYYYFFRPTLATHVHLYHGWVLAARSRGLNVTLTTLLEQDVMADQNSLVDYWRAQEGTHIVHTGGTRYDEAVRRFFGKCCSWRRRAVVHLRKQSIGPFIELRERTRGRLRFVLELEGDAKLEQDFLRHHPYKEGFYRRVLAHQQRRIAEQKGELRAADHVLVASRYLLDLLVQRYPDLDLSEKLSVLPTGATLVGNVLDREARERIRLKLGWSNVFIVTYVGNIFYSWQSLSSCLNAFVWIKQSLQPSAKMLLLVRKADWPMAQDFIAWSQLRSEDYLLTELPPHEIGAYMSASDLGLLLRPKHPAMLAASAGKFGDYVLNGLPVLLSEGAGEYAQMAREDGVLPTIADIDSQEEILYCAARLSEVSWDDRERLARWGREKISSQANADRYVQALKRVALLTHERL